VTSTAKTAPTAVVAISAESDSEWVVRSSKIVAA